MKNILFLGLGSIGQRHFRNLRKIDPKLNFFCIREKKNVPHLNNKNQVVKKKFIPIHNGIKEISWSTIKNYKIDTAFITNPTSLHINTSIKLAQLNLNLFIEKPLSNNLKNITKLRKLIKKKKINCEIGFQSRYDDLLIKIKKIINSKKYGKVVKCNIDHCHYLPNHHKYEDYKISYASNKKLGGGVLLCFSHEIDYAQYLFGTPKKIVPIKISSGNYLNIDVEISAQFSIFYKNNIPVTFNLDFIKKKSSRSCKIQFEKAFIEWDLNKNIMIIENKKIRTFKGLTKNRNDLFIRAMKKIKNCFSKNENAENSFEKGLLNIKTILSIKKSLINKKSIYL